MLKTKLQDALVDAAIRLPLPDTLFRGVIDQVIKRLDLRVCSHKLEQINFDRILDRSDFGRFTTAANQQHYEIPAAFFEKILGPQCKYSCCYFDQQTNDLALAERDALKMSSQYACLRDNIDILELGCGWGSLTFWMAQNYPNSRIVAVSNSSTQIAFIENRLSQIGLANVELIKSDVHSLVLSRRFDRVVSIEMIEHLRDWQRIFTDLKKLTKPEAILYFHHFHHISEQYLYDEKSSWMARHFFTGGIMPKHDSIRSLYFDFDVTSVTRWDGKHYEHTARCWLANYDKNFDSIVPILRTVYKSDWHIWARRWRLFFLGVERMFAWEDGAKWGVSHYTLKAR